MKYLSAETRIRQIAALKQLRTGWNGYQAQPITGIAIDVACHLIRLIAKQHWFTAQEKTFPNVIVPVPNGGVQFEWRRATRELEVGIDPDGTLSYLSIENVAGKEIEKEAERAELAEILKQIASVVLAR